MGNFQSLCCTSTKATSSDVAAAQPKTTHTPAGGATSPPTSRSSNNGRCSLYYFDASMTQSEFDGLSETKREEMAESVFYDTRQSLYSLEYAPATVPNPHLSVSIRMEEPDTLLKDTTHSSSSSETTANRIGAVEDKQKPTRTQASRQTVVIRQELETPASSLGLKGYPGELTQTELEQCIQFRRLLKSHDQVYRDLVHCFRTVEGEPYALCRCLRARKFDAREAVRMLGEHIAHFAKAHTDDFYRDIQGALGCPLPVFLTQCPFVYSGIDKNGCPVAYFMVGQLSMEGLDCVTRMEERVLRFVWYTLKHALEQTVAKGGDSTRCELLVLVDLKGLSRSTINRRTLALLKSIKPAVMAFPEVLNRIVIFNAPSFFSYSWLLIRQFVDARTQSKIEIHSGAVKKKLLQLVDSNELLGNVGGDGPTFEQLLSKTGDDPAASRIVERRKVSPGREAKLDFVLSSGEQADVTIFTNSKAHVKLQALEGHVRVLHAKVESLNGGPHCAEVFRQVLGPVKFSVVIQCTAPSAGYFLVVLETTKLDSSRAGDATER